MRHLLSPPISQSVAAQRERLLASAEQFSHLAEQNELKAMALKGAQCPQKAAKATALTNLAKFQRGRAQEFLTQATNLTDYTDDLDRQTSGWALLTKLCRDAEARALTGPQLNAVSRNPNTTALRHA